MHNFARVSVQTRLFVISGLLGLAVAIVAVTGIVNAATYQEKVASLRSSAQGIERSGSARAALASEQFALKNALLSDDPQDWGQVYTFSGQFYDFLTSQRLASLDNAQRQAIDEIDALRSQYDQEIDKVYATLWDEDFVPELALQTVRENADPIAGQIDQRLEQLAALNQDQVDTQVQRIEQAFQAGARTGRWTIVVLVILLVAAVTVTGQIVQPLHQLTSAIVAFQSGTYRSEMLAPQLGQQDDLGHLTRAIDEMATSITEANHLKDQFIDSAARFIPTQYLEFLEKPAITEVNLGDHVAAEMAVMFSDIRGFTSASEKMTPRENFDFINEYLKLVSPVIQRHEGFIVKFLGDGMMAIFPYGAEDAVQAGIEKQEKVASFNKLLAGHGYPPVSVGIGIHTGQMMVGMIGEERRMQGDAFSDNVNLTARIEGLNKFYGTSMIISEEVRQGLAQPVSYQMRSLGKARVKGRLAPLGLYEVYEGLPAEVAARREATRGSFELGIHLYTSGRFGEAQQAFEAVLQSDPDDRTARYYLERCIDWAGRSTPQDWDGVIVMAEK